ncbi:MAG: tol-pal system protein YbgF [Candidatus Aminicenantes bacterium]|nr:tol-pal system protein YbgF [Candidatus Aminicenantes bacterium]
MPKKIYSGIVLILLYPLLLGGFQKREKAYELIYKDVQILKKKILGLEAQVQQNQEYIMSINKQLDDIFELVNQIRNEQANLSKEQEKIPTQYQILLEKFDTLTARLSDISEDLIEIKQSAKYIPADTEITPSEEGQEPPVLESTENSTETVDQEQKPKSPIDPNLSPQEVYNLARSDYLKGNFQLAIQGFDIYLDHFPESPLADNALYWIGESYFSQEEFEEAVRKFNVLILSYPEGDKVPAAHLKKGISLMEMGRDEEALAVFKLLISKFPLEEETRIAQEKIKEIRSRILS